MCIIPDYYENNWLTKAYHEIYDWCLDNDIIPPDRKDEYITYADGTSKRRNKFLLGIAYCLRGKYIRSWLTGKITKKPEELSLRYIATILNIHIRSERTDYEITLD